MQAKKDFNFHFLPLISFSLTGTILLFLCTALWGIGLSPDSAAYVSAARELLKGNGLTLGFVRNNVPFTHWAPFFPLSLAALGLTGLDPLEGARILNVILFGVNIFLIGFLLKKYTGSTKIAVLGSWTILTSRTTLEIHSYAHSEPIYILLVFLGIHLLIQYLGAEEKRNLYYASSLCMALAALDRYAGVSSIIAGALMIFLLGRKRFHIRLKQSVAFALLGSLPLGLWFVRNHFVSRNLADRSFGFHPPTWYQYHYGLDNISTWILPELFPFALRVLTLVIVSVALVAVSVVVLRKERRDDSFRFLVSTLLFALSSVFTLVAYVTFLSVNMLPVNRHLSPIFVSVAMFSLVVLYKFWRTCGSATWLRRIMIAAAILLCSSYLVRGTKWLCELRSKGLGYAGRSWRTSETIAELKRLYSKEVVYTNSAEAIYILTGRPSFLIPVKYDRSSVRKEETWKVHGRYEERLREMKESLETKGGLLVYFNLADKEMGRWFIPTEEELRERLSLALVKKLSDGSIYQTRST